MSVQPVPADPGIQTPPPTGAAGEVRKGGWLVRIAVLVIVLVWLVPTAGVLVTSFRVEALVDVEGWWTVFTKPFDTAQ